ncbi:uncharacterized protein LOC125204479 [Salvia hispanica]|uniref:uncharacterized protein LOC125204479 n=1 Tax=Salvia hispanica TaxID=49212 RepID=UPI0020092B54|nr:uncharacterized protein LOC125204479 [Salvia hispanica]
MAQELHDGEFWLPSEILTDDDLLMDFKTKAADDLSSATGTESDEDDFITHSSKGLESPQSTLCASSSSKEISGWDLLCAAAEQVQRMRIADEIKPFVKTQASLAFLHLQATNFQQHHSMWGQIDREIGTSQGSMASWPSLHQSQQQQPMKTVFLGETALKKERIGTGVFLPRTLGSVPAQNRNKPGASVKQRRNQNGPFLRGQQRRSQPEPAMSQELRLPQEWTY